MSTAVKEKKPFLPQRKPQFPAAGGPGNAVAVGSQRPAFAANALSIGGEPRVHLLPLEVSERKKVRALKRRLGFAAIATVVVVAAGYGGVSVSLASAQSDLTNAQTQTAQLAAQQAKFSAVTKVKTDAAAIQAAQKSTTSTEVVWKKYVAQIEASLPAGSAIVDFTGSVDAPFGAAATPQSAATLGLPHVATVQLTATMNQNPIGGWLTTLPSLPGFVDATPDSVTLKSDGTYTVVVTIHLNSKALSTRYSKTGVTK
jgi:Tfp pilus assembly protein PilN